VFFCSAKNSTAGLRVCQAGEFDGFGAMSKSAVLRTADKKVHWKKGACLEKAAKLGSGLCVEKGDQVVKLWPLAVLPSAGAAKPLPPGALKGN